MGSTILDLQARPDETYLNDSFLATILNAATSGQRCGETSEASGV
jgi:hypothetical protein